MGLQMAVPRTAAHFEHMLTLFGSQDFHVVPGVTGTTNADAGAWPMNWKEGDGNIDAATQWSALDGGSWFVRPDTFPSASGSYAEGCWLSLFEWDSSVGFKFSATALPGAAAEDSGQATSSGCPFTVRDYVCSTNDVGGPGVDGLAERKGAFFHDKGFAPDVAEPGKYVIQYHVSDAAGNKECMPMKRTVVVVDTLKPVISIRIGTKMVVKGVLEDSNKVKLNEADSLSKPRMLAPAAEGLDEDEQFGPARRLEERVSRGGAGPSAGAAAAFVAAAAAMAAAAARNRNRPVNRQAGADVAIAVNL
jgi:hypothetical protein